MSIRPTKARQCLEYIYKLVTLISVSPAPLPQPLPQPLSADTARGLWARLSPSRALARVVAGQHPKLLRRSSLGVQHPGAPGQTIANRHGPCTGKLLPGTSICRKPGKIAAAVMRLLFLFLLMDSGGVSCLFASTFSS
jgi:hypothetical protein